MRERHCRVCDGWHDLAKPWPHNCRAHFGERPQRGDFPMPAVRSDRLPGGVDGMMSMADGKRYDSRRAYERAVRDSGCEVVGDDRLPQTQPDAVTMSEHEAEAAVAETLDQMGI